MCGIAGGMGSIQPQEFIDMTETIVHRGPDNIGYYSSDNVHLSHVRLSIIDLSESSNQPLWDSGKSACIVFNGEIYNYLELKADLELKGYVFNSLGDSEVLLNMYLEYGVKLFDKVNGIFAFTIWDSRIDEFLVARDHYGVKPLYYTENDSGFYFSSEMKSLFQISSIKKKLNYDAVLRTVVFLWSPGPETVTEGVLKLEPASYLRVKNNKIIEKTKYWSYPKCSETLSDVDKAVEAVQRSLLGSVKDQMTADVPVGAFLSGGLDSSLIVAMAKEVVKKDLKCFTIKSIEDDADGFSDDLPYAIKMAEFLGVPLDIVEANPLIIKLLPHMIYHLDEPQADPAPLNVSLICAEAKAQGIKVLLSGAGGDDVFTGYRRHKAIKFERFWSWLPKPCKLLLRRISINLPKSNIHLKRISKLFQYADLPENERLLSYFYWIDPDIAMQLLSETARKQLSNNPMGSMLKELSACREEDPVEKMLFLERHYFLVDHNFNYTDKMSMAHGVEVRVPFLDKRVINVAAKIPSDLKQKAGHGKWILKKAAEKYLPKSLIYRPKTGFGAPLRHWLKGDLKPLVDTLLSKESIEKRDIFDAAKVNDLIRMDRTGKADYAYPIFSLLCIEIWCRIFLDGKRVNEL